MGRGQIIFVTGTGTGVGKTVFTSHWTRDLLARGMAVRAVKPLCSGGRDDARALAAAQDGRWTLDEINPWAFRAALAPALAARRRRIRVRLPEVVDFCRKAAEGQEVLLVEGAGGLLSPLGEDFDARDLVVRLRANVIVVGWNRLGILNEVLLTLAALPSGTAGTSGICLMRPGVPDGSQASNRAFLRERLGAGRVIGFPFLATGGGQIGAGYESGLGAALSGFRRWIAACTAWKAKGESCRN